MRRALPLLATAILVLAGTAFASPTRLVAHGISLTLLPSWHGRILVSYGNPLLQAANFPLPTKTDANGTEAIRQMRSPNQVFLLLAEVGNLPGTSGFDHASLPIQIGRADILSRAPGAPADRPVARRRFATNGRSFSLLVYFGSRLVPTATVREVNRLLSALRIQRLVPAVAWTRLHRRLHLPKLASGARCPRSSSGRAAPEVYFTLGPGPAYPVLGTRNGVAQLTSDERRGDSYWHKTLWAIGPSFRGPVLVRGRRIDGSGAVEFSLGGGRPQKELRLSPARADAEAHWRYAPSATIIPTPGCYAFQIDGATFSHTAVFLARLAR